ncbi:type I-F CRISPR-associated protein Csy2 [Polycyclovorans algicola]|uniref:type I-F CRISPR-associated protein Csy2 n=1 Tax=Polycyclovorans algicola TaxID=616992 RepID=UPI0004A76242|nr:type I-F CRISPR-associated protein Csy2 [Polycyclovorans algicola]
MTEIPDIGGLLILPRLRIQNANAISSPMTHGFPSITAFLGLMWALGRKLPDHQSPLFDGIGVICHRAEEQVTKGGYVRTFRLTRNPVEKDGGTAAIVEEGRIHLEVSLLLAIRSGDPVLESTDVQRQAVADAVADEVSRSRIAGGSVLPSAAQPWQARPKLIRLDQEPAARARQIRHLRRQWLPGFALVSRDDLLQQRLEALRLDHPEASALDAWLDLSRFNWRAVQPDPDDEAPGAARGAVEWRPDTRKGWIVPIPVGYGGLGALQPASTVANARDAETPLRFVESLYSIGQWVSPHRINDLSALLWYGDADQSRGLYRARNAYTRFVPSAQD